MAIVSMKALLETGVHFGHRTRRWNPKMKSFIFTERNGIHIIDLQQTLQAIEFVHKIVVDTVADGGTMMFVGTKRQAQETIAREATRCGMPYVNQRWLGGTLTNWRTIRQRIEHLNKLEARRERGEFELLTKKEALTLTNEIDKLIIRLSGIREMTSLPDLVFVVDVRREHTAIHEANILKIPVVAMVDTNCDPDLIDYVIPSNDDAIRAIKLITSVMADAILEGTGLRKDEELEEEEEERDYDLSDLAEIATDEAYLGEATLAKLESGELFFEGEEDEEDEEAEAEEAEAETEADEAEAEIEDDEDETEAEDDEDDYDEEDDDEDDED